MYEIDEKMPYDRYAIFLVDGARTGKPFQVMNRAELEDQSAGKDLPHEGLDLNQR